MPSTRLTALLNALSDWGNDIEARLTALEPVAPPIIPPPVIPPPTGFAALQQAGYIPYYLPTGSVVSADYAITPTVESVQDYMPNTGGRPDIQKPLNDWQVLWLINGMGSNAMVQSLLNADAESRFAWHIDDPDGKPWNIDVRPNVAINAAGLPPGGTLISDPHPAASHPGTIDDAHHPQLAYLPFLMATTAAEKEYRLRTIQYQANWAMISYGTDGGLGLIRPRAHQVRGTAHLLMMLGLAAVSTRRWEAEGLTPVRPLLSADYFYRKMENNLRWLEDVSVKSINPLVQQFRFYPKANLDVLGMWEVDMVNITLGTLARMGFTRAKTIFDWGMVGVKARASGTAGWALPGTTAYHVKFRPAPTNQTMYMTWAELQANSDTPHNTNYVHITRGALCLAASMGDAEAATLEQSLRSSMTYTNIGNFFDPAVRPIVMTQPVVNPDPQFTPWLVSDPASTVPVDLKGRNYAATGAGQTAQGPSSFPSTAVTIYAINDFAHVNGSAGTFGTNRAFIKFSDNKIYDVAAKAFLP